MDRKRIVFDFKGQAMKIDCLSCAREIGEVSLGNIVKTKYFDAHQDYEIPIPGFVIISSRRHIQSVDEFTDKEQKDFIKFLARVRTAQRKKLGIDVVYLIQEEDTSHHFHVWMFPRYDWMEKKFGKKIQSVRSIMEYARKSLKTKSNLAKVDLATEKLRKFLLSVK